MEPNPPSSTVTALICARRLLADVGLDLLGIRHRVGALAGATQWRSRATEGYRSGVAALADDLAGLVRLLDVSDADLAAALRDERARVLAQG